MGLENLIYAFKLMVKKRKDALLLIVGEGFLRDKLKQIIKQESLQEYIFLVGAKDSREIADYCRAADLFVMPSEYAEWFGLSTLEALACGTPAAGTPAGATGEILFKLDRRFVFKDVTARAIADGIEMLVQDDSMQETGDRFRKFILENYTWDVVFKKVETVFCEIAQ
jgi:glycosyltransferase involved in cell wall biosynthesis